MIYSRAELQQMAQNYPSDDSLLRLWETMCSCEPGEDQTIGQYGDFSTQMAIEDILGAQDEYERRVRKAEIEAERKARRLRIRSQIRRFESDTK